MKKIFFLFIFFFTIKTFAKAEIETRNQKEARIVSYTGAEYILQLKDGTRKKIDSIVLKHLGVKPLETIVYLTD